MYTYTYVRIRTYIHPGVDIRTYVYYMQYKYRLYIRTYVLEDINIFDRLIIFSNQQNDNWFMCLYPSTNKILYVHACTDVCSSRSYQYIYYKHTEQLLLTVVAINCEMGGGGGERERESERERERRERVYSIHFFINNDLQSYVLILPQFTGQILAKRYFNSCPFLFLPNTL